MRTNPIFLFLLFIFGIFSISGCTQQNTPVDSVQCTDFPCLQQQLLKCNPTELEIEASVGEEPTTFGVIIFGIEEGRCHYAKILKSYERIREKTDCYVPLDKITENIFKHLIGLDEVPGEEAVKIEQDKIEADYCKIKRRY